jgi:glycosyltransferase involved in cell wall biosynthesis
MMTIHNAELVQYLQSKMLTVEELTNMSNFLPPLVRNYLLTGEFDEYLYAKPRISRIAHTSDYVVPQKELIEIKEVTGEITVIGHPSKLGGADTELDHQIRVWQELGVKVRILHTGQIDNNLQGMQMSKRGCEVLKPRDWSQIQGNHIISYCNDQFLLHLDEIKKYAATASFVNCMTWLFDKEKEVVSRGLLDYSIYQRSEVMDKNCPLLKQLDSNLKGHVVRPYFHTEDFPFIPPEKRDYEHFRFGRIHRSDPGKFRYDTKWIYETMVAPVYKEGVALGINGKCEEKIGGRLQEWIHSYECGGIPQQEFYKRVNVLIQPCGVNHTENLPRIAFEAMSSGVPMIVDNRGGWTELVKHKETGYLCNDEKEFVYYSSRMAFEHDEYLSMVKKGREFLLEKWGMDAAKKEWNKFFKMVGVL